MVETFAQELIDNIADHLHNDKSTLAATSTVSHSWLSACRFHLFSMVRVTAPSLHIMDFVVFLEMTPSIHRYVKKVCLRGNIDKSILVRILTCLPRLTHLSIRGPWNLTKSMKSTKHTFKLEYLFLDFSAFSSADARTRHQIDENENDLHGEQVVEAIVDASAPVAGADQVNENHDDEEEEDEDVDDQGLPILHGRTRDYVEARGLVGILSLFAHIGEFSSQLNPESTSGWALSESDLLALIPKPGVLGVHSFNFSGSWMTASTFALFQRLLQSAGIQSFTVNSGGYPTVEPFRRILLGSQNLKHFAIFVRIGGYHHVDVQAMGLERCRNLRSLLIQPGFAASGFLDNDDAQRCVYDWIGIKAILELRVSRVRHLSIQLYDRPLTVSHIMQCLNHIEWVWLEDYLLDNYPMLETVTFRYECRFDNLQHEVNIEAIRSYIREHLPRLHEKGLIRLNGTMSCLKVIDRNVVYSLLLN